MRYAEFQARKAVRDARVRAAGMSRAEINKAVRTGSISVRLANSMAAGRSSGS